MQTKTNLIDNTRFAEARFRVLGESYDAGGIGTYCERTLHRILKLYFEPDESLHEVAFHGKVTDIMNGDGILEVQTRSLGKLKAKLEEFLPHCHVTVVYPLPYEKYIRVIDRESGAVSERKKSPKKCRVYDAFYELYNIREFLCHENLSLKLMFLNIEEFRYNGGKAFGRKRAKVRAECIPDSIYKIIDLNSRKDYNIFIPETLPETFCGAEFSRAIGKRFKHGYSGIRILESVGLIAETERIGRKVIYSRTNPSK